MTSDVRACRIEFDYCPGGEKVDGDRGNLPTWLGRTLSIIALLFLAGAILLALGQGLLAGFGMFVPPALLLILLYALKGSDGDSEGNGQD